MEGAISKIDSMLEKTTDKQQQVIVSLGFDISIDLPKLVTAAKIKDCLADAIDISLLPPRQSVIDMIEQFSKESDGKIAPQTNNEAEAWLKYLLLLRRKETLQDIKISAGDIVSAHNELQEISYFEISSIGDDGRIYFRGGRGAGAWPDNIAVVTRGSLDSPIDQAIRELARSGTLLNQSIGEWSLSKHKEMEEYAVGQDIVTEDDLYSFAKIIDSSNDERPIQKHLESNPNLLTCLLGGRNKYFRPQVRFGSEYIPDFIIGSDNSLGIEWILIELETPLSTIHCKRTDDLEERARKGVYQIRQWREWLTQNLNYACKKKKDEGLGLIDIRPSIKGYVIVGRRRLMRKAKETVRYELREKENIYVHSYDWILSRIKNAA